ncbi:MAG: hypothetical protein ACPG7F_20570 [Aggregatilineales bacterium]
MTVFDTATRPPLPSRPRNGWQAWVATVGYMSLHHSPDAMLKLRAFSSSAKTIGWESALTWGTSYEQVTDCISLEMALQDLWQVAYPRHSIFKDMGILARAPIDYKDDQWIDESIRLTLDRILKVTWSVFDTNWQLVIVYRPVERPEDRVQARLLAEDNMVLVGAKGATLLDALRLLFHRSARIYTLKRDSNA